MEKHFCLFIDEIIALIKDYVLKKKHAPWSTQATNGSYF